MYALPGSKDFGEYAHKPGGKIGGSQIGLQQGALYRLCNFVKIFVGSHIMGKNATGNRMAEHLADALQFAFFFKAAQVGYLPSAEKLDSMGGKFFIKAHDCPHGAVQVRNADFFCQPLPAAYTTEVK